LSTVKKEFLICQNGTYVIKVEQSDWEKQMPSIWSQGDSLQAPVCVVYWDQTEKMQHKWQWFA
jgi:hypothetical protein